MDSAVGFTKRSAVNGDFETRSSAQSKSRDRTVALDVLPTAFQPIYPARQGEDNDQIM